MNPLIKITSNKFLKLKYGNYNGSNNQPILFNKAISNNLSFKRFGFSFIKTFYNISPNNMHNLKLSYNKIFEYESNIKLSNMLKSEYIFNFFNYCNIFFSNELIIKKSFVFLKKIEYNHLFSNYHIKSKIMNMFVDQKNDEINNGNSFYIQNISYFRFFNLPLNKYFDLATNIIPYFSLESIFIQKESPNFKDFFKFIYNFGISLKLNENLFIDVSFLTGAIKNINIKKKHFNSFRIKLSN